MLSLFTVYPDLLVVPASEGIIPKKLQNNKIYCHTGKAEDKKGGLAATFR
jgi:hypothetical protein